MTTRSGWNRSRHLDRLGHGARLGDDLEPRRGGRAATTRPWRTTSWSSTTSRVSGRVGASVMAWRSPRVASVPSAGRWISIRVPVGIALDVHGRTDRCHAGAHVGAGPGDPGCRPRRGSNPRPLSSIRSRRLPSASGADPDHRPRGPRVARDVATAPRSRRPADARSLSRSGSTSIAPAASSTSIIELWRNSSTMAARPVDRGVAPLSSSGRRPKMKLRMSRIVRWRLSIARSTRRSTSSGSSRMSSGTSSSDSPTA